MAIPNENEIVDWLRVELISKLLREEHLPGGKNSEVTKCDIKISDRFTDHFASSPYFVTLEIDHGRICFDLLAKFFPQDDQVSEKMIPDRQFHNETEVYNRILPQFRDFLKSGSDAIGELLPNCYYAHFDFLNQKKSVLVFENLRKFGFRPADSKAFLDFDHCAVAMRQIGRFHALSLSLKMKDPGALPRITEGLMEPRYFNNAVALENCNVFNRKCNQRAIDFLLSLEKPSVPKEYVLMFQEMISQPFELMVRMVQPEEPVALLCHGDYCRNNLLFRYEGGLPVDARLIDFQLSRYGPPSIDLAFFIYLNTTQDLREKHFDELLSIYYTSLVAKVAALLSVSEAEVENRFPFRFFSDDFARHGVYAYFQVAFFLPMMIESSECDWDLTLEEMADVLYEKGGEKVTKMIADVIVDFYKRKFYT